MPIQNPLMNYENKWVALSEDRKKVIADGKTVKELTKKLRKMKKKDVILHYVPQFDAYLAP